jgi:hypothetical protein
MNDAEKSGNLNRKLILSAAVFLPSFAVLAYLFRDYEQPSRILVLVFVIFWLVYLFFTIRYFISIVKSWFE